MVRATLLADRLEFQNEFDFVAHPAVLDPVGHAVLAADEGAAGGNPDIVVIAEGIVAGLVEGHLQRQRMGLAQQSQLTMHDTDPIPQWLAVESDFCIECPSFDAEFGTESSCQQMVILQDCNK